MQYTKAKIFNLALKNLGVSVGIQMATQTDRNTVVLNEYYDIAKEKTLKDHDWSFASSYRDLTPTGNESPDPKFLYEYDYPNDCVFVREIVLPTGEKNTEFSDFDTASDFSTGQRTILTNISPAKIRYTRRITEETFYTPEFAMALSWFLAFLSASSITGARTKSSDCMAVYRKMLSESTVADANESQAGREDTCDWIEARD